MPSMKRGHPPAPAGPLCMPANSWKKMPPEMTPNKMYDDCSNGTAREERMGVRWRWAVVGGGSGWWWRGVGGGGMWSRWWRGVRVHTDE